jgi:hypothetical protein
VSEIPPGHYEPDPPSKPANRWMIATVALVALAVGIGAGLLIEGSGDEQTRTVRGATRTVVQTAPPVKTSVEVTVTQPERTIERTVTAEPETVTVTTPAEGDETTP